MLRNLSLTFKPRNFMFSSKYSPILHISSLQKNKNQGMTCFSTSNNSSAKAVDLAYSLFQPEAQLSSSIPVIILHGLLGSKQNWRGLGKAIAKKSKRKVYTLDARNHGESPHADDYSCPLMAEDVKHFMSSHAISEAVIIGHSMGGRTAMYLACTNEILVNKLIVVDISPISMPKQAHLIVGYIGAMKDSICSIPKLSLAQARKKVDEYLSKTIPEVGIRQFLLTNLDEQNNTIKWKPNLDVLLEKFDSGVMTFPLDSGHYSNETVFIHGGDSPFIRTQEYPEIKKLFPKAEFILVSGAGHWVHSEKPIEFLNVVCDIL